MSTVLLVLTTCPTAETAESLATALVTEGLAACVNHVPGVHSTYIWSGQLQQDNEILLLIKTTADRLAELETRLKALHPYELPELVAIPAAGGSDAYLQWVRDSVARSIKK